MTIDRYISAEWVKTFLLTVAATLGILILEDIYDNLEDLLEYGATLAQIARYYLILIPSFLPVIIPVALLISLLFSLGMLHRNHEIISMRAAGMSLMRITRSLWNAGAILALGLFFLNAKLVPWSVEQSRLITENLEFAHEAQQSSAQSVGLIYNLSFDNRSEKRLWLMNRFSQYTYQGFGVNVFMLDDKGNEHRRIMAREAYYDDLENFWVFQEGREILFDQANGEPLRSLNFEQQEMPELTENPILMTTLNKEPDDLSLFELDTLLQKISPEENAQVTAYAVRYQRILATPFVCFIAVALAIPFSVRGVRTNPLVGAAQSIGLFFVYYLAASFCIILGERALLSPMIAAWLPNILMLIFTVSLYRKWQ